MVTGTSYLPVLIVIIMVVRTRKIIERFRSSGTTTPLKAKTLQELNLRSRMIVNRLVRRKLLVETTPGCYYLQENMLAEFYQKRRTHFIVILLVIAILVIADIYFTHYF
ncbi:MAG: hypothetical protein WCL00_14240 [Bacteroidota bacterium]